MTLPTATLMRKLGCDLELVGRDRMLAIEPALRFTNANVNQYSGPATSP